MAVGLPLKTTYANGDVYSASDVNDTNGTVNLFTSSTLSVAAGKNVVINGGMDIWQRGTSIAGSAVAYNFTADRWRTEQSTSITVSRQATNDTTNLPSIQYCARAQRNNASVATALIMMAQSFETVNSIPYAGKTVTFSFYARRGANFSGASNQITALVASGTGTDQSINVGGYTGTNVFITQNVTLTTTWQRFSYTGTVPTTATEMGLEFFYTPTGTAGAADYYEVTGVQLELGSTATTFSRAGGTIQGELAACQRYYVRYSSTDVFHSYANGMTTSTTVGYVTVPLPVEMRVAPTTLDTSTVTKLETYNSLASNKVLSAIAIDRPSNKAFSLVCTISGATNGQVITLRNSNDATAYFGVSAEL